MKMELNFSKIQTWARTTTISNSYQHHSCLPHLYQHQHHQQQQGQRYYDVNTKNTFSNTTRKISQLKTCLTLLANPTKSNMLIPPFSHPSLLKITRLVLLNMKLFVLPFLMNKNLNPLFQRHSMHAFHHLHLQINLNLRLDQITNQIQLHLRRLYELTLTPRPFSRT